LAEEQKLPEADAQDLAGTMWAVRGWLLSHERWLYMLDNADDLETARLEIPPGKNGHFLMTTRAGAIGAMARVVKIQEMAIQEGALFLLRRAQYIAEDAVLEAAGEDDRARAKEIVSDSMASLWPLTKQAPTSKRPPAGS
jgi:hypothetical protein